MRVAPASFQKLSVLGVKLQGVWLCFTAAQIASERAEGQTKDHARPPLALAPRSGWFGGRTK
eukprot:11031666-Alexandrium_andersonii.AAC.1